MADDSTRRQPQTIFAGGSNITLNSNEAGGISRLLIDSQSIRNSLESRNLYTPDVEYPLSPNTVQKIVNAISSIGSALAPFSGVDLKDTIIGRAASAIGGSSPLSEIGLVMLGKQFVMNSASHLEQTYMPTIDLSGFLKGGKLFKKAIDYSITVTPQTGFQTFLQNLVGGGKTYKNPFNSNPTNAEIIKNTGTAQLNYLYTALNNNIYKQDDQTLTNYGVIAGTPILLRNIITANQTFFNFNSNKEYPYMTYHPSGAAAVDADQNMRDSYAVMSIKGQEYAPDAGFITDNFGTTDKTEVNYAAKDSYNEWISTNKEFGNDDITKKLVWGRDGLDPLAEKKLAQLRGDSDPAQGQITPESISTFKIKGGLLEYTRNLLNATEGNFVDITRKAFKDGDKLVGFNGSGLWRAPISGMAGSKYAANSGNADKQGVRQHTVLDQYDKFAKTIRFMGNQVYGGNKDSVIYKSVLPRIHPTLDKDGKPDPKNLMFSIENLAIRVLSKDTYGIIDDEYGSPIPACEVGPFNGRIMWFPPYNLEINETGQAKFEPTTIIGRNEPMYNYMNSERSATLSFTLLVDYPQQLKNYMGQDKQRDIAQFFAFGGDPYTDNFVSIENYQFKIAKLTTEIENIKGKTVISEPNEIPNVNIDIVFPNDVPTISDNINTIIDDLYKKYTYEIIEGLPSSDVTSWGLNGDVFFKTGVTYFNAVNGKDAYFLDSEIANSVSQYTSVALTDEYGDNKLNKTLFDVFNDENNKITYSVYIHGAASKLYLSAGRIEYNKKLGERRAEAVQILIQKKLAAMFGQSVAQGIEVTFDTIDGTIGDSQASDATATIAAIPYKETKQARCAHIEIRKNGRTLPPKKAELNSTDATNILKLQAEIEAAKVQIQKIKTNQSCVYKERSDGDAILHGFNSVSGNYFYPVFHSQTPEDFHKRLTFLHQCQRQGAAKRWNDPVSGENSAMARNSVFGRQPICILRVGDFFYTKVIIENYTIDYTDTTWDMNPEGFGMQPMLAKVTLQMKLMGGQSLKGPIDALQNAVSFNYYANSSFTNAGMYKLPSKAASDQESFIKEILTTEQAQMNKKYDDIEKVMNIIINNGLLLH
jgi:hypothetical protein